MKQKAKKDKIFLVAISFLTGILFLLLQFFPFEPKSFATNSKMPNHTSCNASYSPKILVKAEETQPIVQDSGYCLTVPVLLYHHIQPTEQAVQKGQTSLNVDNGVFDQQMGYLSAQGYTTLSSDQLVDALRTKAPLPPKSIVITFDDGYLDNYLYAYPILQKYRLVGNIMVITGLLENGDYLTWGQLKEMVGSGLVNAYNHTWSHVNVNNVPIEKANEEIMIAKTQLEQNLGRSVNIFTYPYGLANSSVISLLAQNGFTGAFSTIGGWTQCDSFIMSLHRNRVGNSSLSSYGL